MKGGLSFYDHNALILFLLKSNIYHIKVPVNIFKFFKTKLLNTSDNINLSDPINCLITMLLLKSIRSHELKWWPQTPTCNLFGTVQSKDDRRNGLQ